MCSFAELHVSCRRRSRVAVQVTFIYDTLQNRAATLLTSKCVFSPFLNCPMGTPGCRSEDERLFCSCSPAAEKLLSPGHDWVSLVDDAVGTGKIQTVTDVTVCSP